MDETNSEEHKPVTDGVIKAIDDAQLKADVPVEIPKKEALVDAMGGTEQSVSSTPDSAKPSTIPVVIIPSLRPGTVAPPIVAKIAPPPDTGKASAAVIPAALTPEA
ncbi:MAG: hypothetical protein ABSA63_04990 [Thermoplasmata archaeon]|jgi:hypothetical protein